MLDGPSGPEQKSSRHVGQCTAHGDGMLEDDGDSGTIRSEQIEEPVWFAPAWSPACCSLGPTRQIVSQPAFGHQVRDRSSSTSVKEKEYKRIQEDDASAVISAIVMIPCAGHIASGQDTSYAPSEISNSM
uniref:Uncharacterized protein n=1 Tax=Anopheles melas TaxID=34690 RepID=A0A182TK24_9DIPT